MNTDDVIFRLTEFIRISVVGRGDVPPEVRNGGRVVLEHTASDLRDDYSDCAALFANPKTAYDRTAKIAEAKKYERHTLAGNVRHVCQPLRNGGFRCGWCKTGRIWLWMTACKVCHRQIVSSE